MITCIIFRASSPKHFTMCIRSLHSYGTYTYACVAVTVTDDLYQKFHYWSK